MLQPAMRSISRLSSTNGSSSASARRRPSVDLPAPRSPISAMRRPRAGSSGAGAEQLADGDAGAAQVGVALAAQRLAQHQPLGRAGRDVADQLGEVAVERAGDLLQDQDRGVADAVFEVGQVPLRHARGLGDRLASQAAARPQEPDALAEGEQEGILGRGRHSCTIVLDDAGRKAYRAAPAAVLPLPRASHDRAARDPQFRRAPVRDQPQPRRQGRLRRRSRRAPLRRSRRPLAPFRRRPPRPRHSPRGARPPADARLQRVAGRFPRRALRRRRPGRRQHAAHRRRLRATCSPTAAPRRRSSRRRSSRPCARRWPRRRARSAT